MKIMTILGTRPEIIRLALIMPKLDRSCQHCVVHTGQNHSPKLKDVFFGELRLRQPDAYLGAESPLAGPQLARIFEGTHELLAQQRPDRVLILGDTNSGLAAIIAEKMMIPVFHLEAGNRCYDLEVPEEKNRRLIDTVSSFNLPYTPRSCDNLLREGVHPARIMTCGNPIFEVLEHYARPIDRSPVLRRLGLRPGQYFLVTAHRAENVDRPARLEQVFRGLDRVAQEYKLPVICSIHPRTREKMGRFGLQPKSRLVKLCEPFGFFDFVKLEKNALAVITDSGTVQEECCLFHVPTVTIRRTTERPETVECGSNMLSGLDGDRVLECVRLMLGRKRDWGCPTGYLDPNVSEKVVTFILSHNEPTV